MADSFALSPAVFQQKVAAGEEGGGRGMTGGLQVGQTVSGGKERSVRLVAQDVRHDFVAFGRRDVGRIADQQMQTAGGERGLRHIACQTAQTGLHAMRPGIASGDGQSGRTEVQQQALPAGALCEEGDADAA